MNHTLSAIKRCPRAVVLNLIDAMHTKRLVIRIASMGFNTTACGSNFIAENVHGTVYESNFARSVKTAVTYHTVQKQEDTTCFIISTFLHAMMKAQWFCYRGFITSCKEDLSVKRHLAVTNVSSH